jgi:hypothetical protein
MTPRFTPSITTLLLILTAACAKPADKANKSTKVAKARSFKAEQDMRHLRRECDQYQALHGELPTDWDEVGKSAIDPWGTEYALDVEDGIVDIYSAGPDGEFDTNDDVRALADGRSVADRGG